MAQRLFTYLSAALLGAAAMALAAAPQAANADVTLQSPFFITSAGQALDYNTINIVMEDAGLEAQADPRAGPDDFADAGTLIIAMGVSDKGLGAANITIEDEIRRTEQNLTAAREQDMVLVGAHVGGVDRRGGRSEQFVQLVSPLVDVLVVTESSNHDGYFAEVAEEQGIHLIEVSNPLEVGPALADLVAN